MHADRTFAAMPLTLLSPALRRARTTILSQLSRDPPRSPSMTTVAASSSMAAPPLLATKAAYAQLVAASQKFVATHSPAATAAAAAAASSSPSTLTPEQIRQVKNALNSMSQSVFSTLRRHLRIAGRQEAEDLTLPAQVAAAQEKIKAERLQLHALHMRAQQLVDAQLKAPLAHLDPQTGRVLGEAPIAVPPTVDLPRPRPSDATAFETLQSGLEELRAKADPAALIEADKDLATVLASRGAKPLSEEVRATLIAANKIGKGKRGAKANAAAATAAAAAAQPTAASAEGYGKVIKSPNSRLSARMASQPY